MSKIPSATPITTWVNKNLDGIDSIVDGTGEELDTLLDEIQVRIKKLQDPLLQAREEVQNQLKELVQKANEKVKNLTSSVTSKIAEIEADKEEQNKVMLALKAVKEAMDNLDPSNPTAVLNAINEVLGVTKLPIMEQDDELATATLVTRSAVTASKCTKLVSKVKSITTAAARVGVVIK